MPDAPISVTATNAADVATILKGFLKPFPENEIKLKPQMVKNNRCLALAFIDSRLVMDRLDEVVGLNGWKDEYTVLPGGTEVECRLSVRIAGEWITKADVGGESEQPDGGDRMKAAFSDALKRAAVKFGIGRFLYRRPQNWMDYDPKTKRIIRPGTGQQQKAPAPQATTLKTIAQQCRDAITAAKSRDELTGVYRQFEGDVKAGKFTDAERADLDRAFQDAGKRFPKQPAGA